MSIILKDKIEENVMLGMWRIVESVDDFFHMDTLPVSLKSEIAGWASVQRKREVLAVRSLLCSLFGHYIGLNYNTDGKPYLENGYNISISHSKDIATVIVSPKRKVAIDIEYVSKRVERVVDRLLRTDERAVTLIDKLLHWCAKETLYKLYSEEHLALADIRVLSVNGNMNNGIIVVENVQRGETLNVVYRIYGEFVLTYAIL